jgi:uncharacterized damage-inducible protein DinB
MDAKTVLVEQMTRVSKVFLKTLEEFPEEQFHTDLPSGGNSVAWHALHIADWSNILVPAKLENVDTTLKFAYLGWEEADFAKAVHGLGTVNLKSSKAEIIAHTKQHLERAATDLLEADATRLEGSVLTPMGERKLLAIIMTHVAHVPYHYGQIKLNTKQLL